MDHDLAELRPADPGDPQGTIIVLRKHLFELGQFQRGVALIGEVDTKGLIYPIVHHPETSPRSTIVTAHLY